MRGHGPSQPCYIGGDRSPGTGTISSWALEMGHDLLFRFTRISPGDWRPLKLVPALLAAGTIAPQRRETARPDRRKLVAGSATSARRSATTCEADSRN